jgi:hypothetical protein
MKLAFILSMPGCNSWNGKWSGEGRLYAKVVNFPGKKRTAHAEEILQRGYYCYNFGDGWAAGVAVKEVDGAESAKIKRHSQGFCGYDWMIDSVLLDGAITSPSVRKRMATGGTS